MPAADYEGQLFVLSYDVFEDVQCKRAGHTDKYPRALLIPSASALRSDAAIDAYSAATLNSTLARSYVREGSAMLDSPVNE